MQWVALIAFIVVSVLLLRALRKEKPRPPANPSVIVDMDDQPPTEIDFDAGIRANRKEK